MTLLLVGQQSNSPLHFSLLPAINCRQEVLHHISLPVVQSPISFDFLRSMIHIFDIHPRVVLELSEPDFVVFFIQRFLRLFLLYH